MRYPLETMSVMLQDPPVRTRSGETTVSSAPPPPPLLHAPSSLTHRTSLPLPDLSLPEPSDPTRLFPPPLAPGKHSTLLPGLQVGTRPLVKLILVVCLPSVVVMF